jgi:hypothetical protein
VAIGRASGGTPDTPEFPAQSKMRPNEVFPESHIFVNYLQGEALYTDFQARVLCVARTHGVSAQDWAEDIYRKV